MTSSCRFIAAASRMGEKLMDCDCGKNENCLTQKTRMSVCTKDVMSSMRKIHDESSAITCTLAYMLCTSDTSCFTGENYYDY